MKNRIFAVLTALLLLLAVTSPYSLTQMRLMAEAASEWTVPEGYNEHDYNAIASFLEQTDGDGVKNGYKLNSDYDVNDPNTWIGTGDNRIITWTEHDGLHFLESVYLDNLCLCGELDLSNCQWIEAVSFEKDDVVSANLSNCRNLWYVAADYNYALADLNISDCPAMQRVFCDGTLVSELDLSNKPLLYSIGCSDTQITELDVSGAPQLCFLNCAFSNISSLDLSNCNLLYSVTCGACGLEELILPAELETPLIVNCTLNELTELDLSHCLALCGLYCSDNHLTSLDVTHCPNLKYLDCSVNELTEIDVSHCPLLRQFYCTQNRITQFFLMNNPELALDFVMVEGMEGSGTVSYGYSNNDGEIVARVFAVPDEGSVFVGWVNIAGQIVSTDWDYDFTSIIGIEPGLIARFALKTVEPGDVDEDGTVSVADALLVLRSAMGILELAPDQISLGDMNGDGSISVDDALVILRLAMGLIEL
ncbi:MAG: hypothetical protein IKO51_06670 [Clostridia bacterium]|nr:hypothetical protein [Clostridia bacterium]